jgi:monoamine oxidase
MQATMFQPKGGMDAIPHAFAKALGPKIIKRQCEVRQIRKTGKGVKIAYRDKVAEPVDATIEADYCISTIPLPVLAKIDADFSPAYKPRSPARPIATASRSPGRPRASGRGPSTRSMAASRS